MVQETGRNVRQLVQDYNKNYNNSINEYSQDNFQFSRQSAEQIKSKKRQFNQMTPEQYPVNQASNASQSKAASQSSKQPIQRTLPIKASCKSPHLMKTMSSIEQSGSQVASLATTCYTSSSSQKRFKLDTDIILPTVASCCSASQAQQPRLQLDQTQSFNDQLTKCERMNHKQLQGQQSSKVHFQTSSFMDQSSRAIMSHNYFGHSQNPHSQDNFLTDASTKKSQLKDLNSQLAHIKINSKASDLCNQLQFEKQKHVKMYKQDFSETLNQTEDQSEFKSVRQQKQIRSNFEQNWIQLDKKVRASMIRLI